MATVVRENIGLLNDKLTVKLAKEDYLPAFEKKLKEYSKTANMPGFRKGLVPIGMIKKMYGAGIYSDEVLRTIEKELFNYLDTEKPEIFAQPLPIPNAMSKLDMNQPDEVTFAFEIGLKPSFTLPSLATANLSFYKVAITDDMIKEDLANMLEKSGKPTIKESITEPADEVNFLFAECDENAIDIENGTSKEIKLGIHTFNQKMQAQLIGKQVNDNFVCQLQSAFEGDNLQNVIQKIGLENNDEVSQQKYFKLTIIDIATIEKATLNEDFFNQIFPNKGITTEADFKTALQTDLQSYWHSQSTNQLHNDLYQWYLSDTQMEFPQQFLTRWLQSAGDKPRTEQEAEQEYPAFEKQLKWTLISDTIVKNNNISVTDTDLRDSMRNEVSRYFGNMNMGEDTSWLESYIDRMMKDEKQVEASYRRLMGEKIFNWAAEQATPSEKIVTTAELIDMQKK